MVCHGSSFGPSARPPSQGRCEEALRPAWAIWMPNFVPGSATAFTATSARAMARSLASE